MAAYGRDDAPPAEACDTSSSVRWSGQRTPASHGSPYGHDLNPVEQVWGDLKNTELANLCPDTIDDAAVAVDDGLMRIGSDAGPCFAFLRHCRLSL